MRKRTVARWAALGTLAVILALEIGYLRSDTLFYRAALAVTAIAFLAVGYAEGEEVRLARKQRKRMNDVLGKR